METRLLRDTEWAEPVQRDYAGPSVDRKEEADFRCATETVDQFF
jgi:hypothetical protein